MLEGLHSINRSDVLYNCFFDLCNAKHCTLDSDLGGIGVSMSSRTIPLLCSQIAQVLISYILQLGISFLVPLLMLCMLLLGACSYPPHHRYKKRHRPALIAAFDEFHRAQCLFTAAIQIASIIVLKDSHMNSFG